MRLFWPYAFRESLSFKDNQAAAAALLRKYLIEGRSQRSYRDWGSPRPGIRGRPTRSRRRASIFEPSIRMNWVNWPRPASFRTSLQPPLGSRRRPAPARRLCRRRLRRSTSIILLSVSKASASSRSGPLVRQVNDLHVPFVPPCRRGCCDANGWTPGREPRRKWEKYRSLSDGDVQSRIAPSAARAHQVRYAG